jgi:hypothetical protein
MALRLPFRAAANQVSNCSSESEGSRSDTTHLTNTQIGAALDENSIRADEDIPLRRDFDIFIGWLGHVNKIEFVSGFGTDRRL